MYDLISRRAAIEVIDAILPVDPMKNEYAQGITCGAALAKTYVEQLPSAQPEIVLELLKTQPTIEPRKGKWKEHKDYPGLAYLCSECGYFTTMRTNFCPNCGADMREGGEDA